MSCKINLTLKVINKREDGFHNIESIMQTINLFDYLTISVEDNTENQILLSGNSTEIPYNEKNLIYKAGILYLEKTGIKNKKYPSILIKTSQYLRDLQAEAQMLRACCMD